MNRKSGPVKNIKGAGGTVRGGEGGNRMTADEQATVPDVSLHLALLAIHVVDRGLMKKNLQRDIPKEEQRGYQENEPGCVLPNDHQAEQSDQLEGEQQRRQVHSKSEQQWIILLALLPLPDKKPRFRWIGRRFLDDRLRVRIVCPDPAEHRVTDVFIQEEYPGCDPFQKLAEANVHGARDRVGFRIVKRV